MNCNTTVVPSPSQDCQNITRSQYLFHQPPLYHHQITKTPDHDHTTAFPPINHDLHIVFMESYVHKMKSFRQPEIELFYCHDFSCLAKIRFHSTPVWVTMHLFWMIGYEQFVSHAVKNVDVSLMLVINIVAGKAMHWKHARRLLLMRKRDSSQLCTLSKHFPTAFLSRIIVKAF